MAALRNHSGDSSALPSWAALGIVLVAVGAANIAAVVALVIAYPIWAIPQEMGPVPTPDGLEQFVEDLQGSALGSAILILPQQTIFFGVAALVSLLYRGQVRDRYRLKKPRGRPWQWIGAVLATLGPAMLLSFAVDALREEPLDVTFRFQLWFQRQQGWNLVGLLVLIAGVPAICEELLFRGFLLSQLERRWPAWLAVLVTAAAFAAAHLDPWHILLVIPLGLWTCLVTRAFDSIYVAIVAHLYNNVAAVLLVVSGHDSESLTDPVTAILFAVSMAAFVISLPVIRAGLQDVRWQRAEAPAEEVFVAIAVGQQTLPPGSPNETSGAADSGPSDPT